MILGVRGALTVEFRHDLAAGSAPLRSAEPLPVQAGPGLETWKYSVRSASASFWLVVLVSVDG